MDLLRLSETIRCKYLERKFVCTCYPTVVDGCFVHTYSTFFLNIFSLLISPKIVNIIDMIYGTTTTQWMCHLVLAQRQLLLPLLQMNPAAVTTVSDTLLLPRLSASWLFHLLWLLSG